MTREQAARWLAVRNNLGHLHDDEYERAYLALTAQPEGFAPFVEPKEYLPDCDILPPAASACPLCGWPKPNVVGHCLKHNLTNPSVPTRGGDDSDARAGRFSSSGNAPLTGDVAGEPVATVGQTPGQPRPGSLTVAGALDWKAAACEMFRKPCFHDNSEPTARSIVTAATRNLKVVKVPTREEMQDSISSAVSKALGGGVDRYAAQVATDAVLALMEVEK